MYKLRVLRSRCLTKIRFALAKNSVGLCIFVVLIIVIYRNQYDDGKVKRLLFVCCKTVNISFIHASNHPPTHQVDSTKRLFTSRKHLRTKVTPDFHLTYSKNGRNLGSDSIDNFQYFFIKSYVVDVY